MDTRFTHQNNISAGNRSNFKTVRSTLLYSIDQARMDLERLSLELKTGTMEDAHSIANRVVDNLHQIKEECKQLHEKLQRLTQRIQKEGQS